MRVHIPQAWDQESAAAVDDARASRRRPRRDARNRGVVDRDRAIREDSSVDDIDDAHMRDGERPRLRRDGGGGDSNHCGEQTE